MRSTLQIGNRWWNRAASQVTRPLLTSWQYLRNIIGEKRRKALQERRLAREKAIEENFHVWEHEILPDWRVVQKNPNLRKLWWQGIPAKLRAPLWEKAVGNGLALSKGTLQLAHMCSARSSMLMPNQFLVLSKNLLLRSLPHMFVSCKACTIIGCIPSNHSGHYWRRYLNNPSQFAHLQQRQWTFARWSERYVVCLGRFAQRWGIGLYVRRVQDRRHAAAQYAISTSFHCHAQPSRASLYAELFWWWEVKGWRTYCTLILGMHLLMVFALGRGVLQVNLDGFPDKRLKAHRSPRIFDTLLADGMPKSTSL